MQKSILFKTQTRRFEDDLEDKIRALEKDTEQLSQLNTNVHDIVNSAAHNLRTSLVVIKAYSNLLMHYDGEEKREALNHMKDSALKMERIVNRMIELTDVQRNEEFTEQMLHFDEIFEEVKLHLADDIEMAEPVFSDSFDIENIHYNKISLFSIMFNLISNSIMYRDNAKKLHINIKTRKENGFVVLSVTDNGEGIDLNRDLKRLFKPFSRLAMENEGLGTGLFLIRSIVEKNGGKIRIDSTPDSGTTVRIFLKPSVEF